MPAAADDHHQQEIEGKAEGERLGSMNCTKRRIKAPGDAAEGGADGEGEQRVAPRVDAEALRAHGLSRSATKARPQGERNEPPQHERQKRQ